MLQRNFYQEHAANSIYLQPKPVGESSPFVGGAIPMNVTTFFFGTEMFPLFPPFPVLNAVFEASTSTGA